MPDQDPSPTAGIPLFTVIGLQVGFLLSGAILTESIFSWPGIGRWLYDEIQLRDYPVIQATTILLALAVVVMNLLTDLAYIAADPRLRVE